MHDCMLEPCRPINFVEHAYKFYTHTRARSVCLTKTCQPKNIQCVRECIHSHVPNATILHSICSNKPDLVELAYTTGANMVFNFSDFQHFRFSVISLTIHQHTALAQVHPRTTTSIITQQWAVVAVALVQIMC